MGTVNYLDSFTGTEACSLLSRLRSRIDAGEPLSAVGRELGVSKQAVSQWLTGAARPSRTVLLLATHLYRAPVDLAAGLPGDDLPDGG